jgi:hypothetical protein
LKIRKNVLIKLLGTLLTLTALFLTIKVIPGLATAPDPGDPGCLLTNPNGGIIGLNSGACSDILLDLSCGLVPPDTETVDRGRYEDKNFAYDVECHDVFGGPQLYHYKASIADYKEGVNGYLGTNDTFIRPDSPDSVMPSNFAMEVVAPPFPAAWLRGLVRFANQQVLPPQSQILSAELSMVCQEAVPQGGVPGYLNGGGMNVDVYGLQQQFNENEATWNNYATGLPWATPGAEGSTDRNASPDSNQFILNKCSGNPSILPGDPVEPTPYTWNVFDGYMAQKSLGKEEFGWVFFTPDQDGDAVRFFTHEMSQVDAPELQIKYVQ